MFRVLNIATFVLLMLAGFSSASPAATTQNINQFSDIACDDGDFLCVNDGFCIPGVWVCDGMEDCYDGLDELNCGDITTPTGSTTTTTSTITTTSGPLPGSCNLPFTMVGSQCLMMVFHTGTWEEMKHRCSKYGGHLLDITNANGFQVVLSHIAVNGLNTHDYWTDGRKEAGETQYYWNTTGEPLPSGSPFWAINYVSNSDDNYSQEPLKAYDDTLQNVFLKKDRAMYLSNGGHDHLAGAICQKFR